MTERNRLKLSVGERFLKNDIQDAKRTNAFKLEITGAFKTIKKQPRAQKPELNEIYEELSRLLGKPIDTIKNFIWHNYNSTIAARLRYYEITFVGDSKTKIETDFTIKDIEDWFISFYKTYNRKPQKVEIDKAIKDTILPPRELVAEIEKGESYKKILKRINILWELGDFPKN
ncbi:MAG: hypothetical protein COT92_00775 [Candidatus Doudnabacteria bacterium CG10_big_fil_rev_8_21_14_0_10_42_18]|uniref:Uncharacterized protein n=1 Tax=Candidatus Doudnabacteria bacterium CG10_big_fil_rev_8_21_14_0_10_42_18 TaxID=1974552 RepID=A0A2H0VBP0_9BACT|nr:MAG: hypothetical protein COT92_00775 [Candidatus Doudnabacteria bacterium CG10_big_fil_rev_8_21_14_0_10_42_18]